MSRKPKEPLKILTEEEKAILEEVSKSRSLPWVQVCRAKALLGVAEGKSYTKAAHDIGYKLGDSVSEWVLRFNREGVKALGPKHGGGPEIQYGAEEKKRILEEFRRSPERLKDGTSIWSLETLKKALRNARDGLPKVSSHTIRKTLKEAGYSWQRSETWCHTGQVVRKRKDGLVVVDDPDKEVKKI